MTCINAVYLKLKDVLLENGYKFTENKQRWGFEFIVENRGDITTINIYNSKNNTITIEVSSLSSIEDYTVDIIDCGCDDGDIYKCIDTIMSRLKSH